MMTDAHTGGDSALATVIKAAPGYVLHSYRITAHGAAELHMAPIVAWRVEQEIATPIPAASQQFHRWAFPAGPGLNHGWLIQTPTDKFYDGAAEYSGLSSWLDDLLHARRQELALKAPEAADAPRDAGGAQPCA